MMHSPISYFLLFVFLVSTAFSEDTGCGSRCTGSCCEISKGEFHCCPYINGVCCGDGKFCCPYGSTCDPSSLTCRFINGVSLPKKELLVSDVSQSLTTLAESPTVCPDRKSACPNNSTCCSMAGGGYGCCAGDKAVCCPDQLHCCPHGTKCNVEKQGCERVEEAPSSNEVDKFFSLLFTSEMGRARKTTEQVSSGVTYSGVKCDASHECPSETTCCRDTTGSFACCPFPRAVCCTDGIHCCPEHYSCDIKLGQCISSRYNETAKLIMERNPPKKVSSQAEQTCPDGQSSCPELATCCKLSDNSWGCCPFTEAVCCSDGFHCCPTGYKCSVEQKRCLRVTTNEQVTPPPAPAPSTVCPNPEFHCRNGTTCCSLPNDEWACCPFPKAVCCSDQAHCCPENTTCDVENNRCLSSVGGNRIPLVRSNGNTEVSKIELVRKDFCESMCILGTCCKTPAGDEACCPVPGAVCCSDGLHCCPFGMSCSGNTCVFSSARDTVPWAKKMLATKRPPVVEEKPKSKAEEDSVKLGNTICRNPSYICKGGQTCCRLNAEKYACCPFENGTCCNDQKHCCPANTTCGPFGQCLRPVSVALKQTVSQAFRMKPTVRDSSLPSVEPILNRMLGKQENAEWCGGLCPDNGFCCPDASGTARRRCCPATAGKCCADGEHCCPRGTRCIGNGQCQSEEPSFQTTLAPYLVPAMDSEGNAPDFLKGLSPQSFHFVSMASESPRAKVNPMFLLDSYYYQHVQNVTVCPDFEHTCLKDQKCCSSLKHRYTCAPKTSVCCRYTADTHCPLGTTCSKDGSFCLVV